jgi:hypothetical protein
MRSTKALSQSSNCFGGDVAAAHDLRQRRVLEIRQTRAPLRVRVEEVPQATPARLRLELLKNRRVEVRVTRRAHLLVVHRFGGVDVRIHEREQIRPVFLGTVRNLKEGHQNS